MFALEDLFDVKDIDQDGKKFDNGKGARKGSPCRPGMSHSLACSTTCLIGHSPIVLQYRV
jgi:hypothetical protein